MPKALNLPKVTAANNFQSTFVDLPIACVIVNEEGTIKVPNNRFCKVFETTENQVVHGNIQDFFVSDIQKLVNDILTEGSQQASPRYTRGVEGQKARSRGFLTEVNINRT